MVYCLVLEFWSIDVLKKYLSIFLLACSTLVSMPSLAQLSDSEAMNMAGLQRSLSQRMVKNYLMLGADVRVDAAQRQLQETVERFDASQKALAGYAPTAEIKAALAKVDATWAVHRQRVEAKPECSTWPSPGVCLRRTWTPSWTKP